MPSDRPGRTPSALLLLAALLLLVWALLYNELILGLIDPSPPLDPDTVRQVRSTQGWFAGTGLLLLILSQVPYRFRGAGIALDSRVPKHALLMLLATGVPMVVLELSLRPFRTLEHEVTSIFIRDDVLGWRLRPGARDVWMGIPVTINAKGLRGPEVDYDKPEGVTRILYLGDSVTFGFKIPRYEETFPHRVEERLLSGGRRVETINAGVDGYSPWQERAYLETEGLRYHPDLVVVGFVLNDVTERLQLTRFGGTGEGFQLQRNASSRLMRMIEGSSIVAFGRQIVARVRFGADVRAGAARREELDALALAEHPDRPDVVEAWRGTLADLEGIFDLCRQRGLRVALVVFPYKFQFQDPDALDAPQRTMAAFAGEHGVPMLDLLPELLSMRSRGVLMEDLFLDRNHPTVEGHRVVGGVIAAWLESAGLLPPNSMMLGTRESPQDQVFSAAPRNQGLQRILELPPRAQAAEKRSHTRDPAPEEEQRRTGARRFVGSRAVEDDLAVARDLMMTRLQIVRRQQEGAGDLVRLGRDIERVPQVDDEDRLT